MKFCARYRRVSPSGSRPPIHAMTSCLSDNYRVQPIRTVSSIALSMHDESEAREADWCRLLTRIRHTDARGLVAALLRVRLASRLHCRETDARASHARRGLRRARVDDVPGGEPLLLGGSSQPAISDRSRARLVGLVCNVGRNLGSAKSFYVSIVIDSYANRIKCLEEVGTLSPVASVGDSYVMATKTTISPLIRPGITPNHPGCGIETGLSPKLWPKLRPRSPSSQRLPNEPFRFRPIPLLSDQIQCIKTHLPDS